MTSSLFVHCRSTAMGSPLHHTFSDPHQTLHTMSPHCCSPETLLTQTRHVPPIQASHLTCTFPGNLPAPGQGAIFGAMPHENDLESRSSGLRFVFYASRAFQWYLPCIAWTCVSQPSSPTHLHACACASACTHPTQDGHGT
jgi:hypothetical protein